MLGVAVDISATVATGDEALCGGLPLPPLPAAVTLDETASIIRLINCSIPPVLAATFAGPGVVVMVVSGTHSRRVSDGSIPLVSVALPRPIA